MRDARRLEVELRRLEPIAAALARQFFVPGADAGDVRQLGMIGIWQALQQWDGRRPIEPLARLAARRRILDAIAATQTEGRRGELEARGRAAGQPADAAELLAGTPAPIGLEELLEDRARLRALVAVLPSLSPLERRTLAEVANGRPYARLAAGGSSSASNAVERGRAKIRRALAATIAA